jgi:phage terminase small subunit
MARKRLTPREETFCRLIVEGKITQREAYREAFKATTMSDEQVDKNAWKMKNKPLVKNKILEYVQAIDETTVLNIQKVLEFWTGVIQDNNVSMKDRLKASELLGKYRQMFVDKVEIHGTIEINVVPPDFSTITDVAYNVVEEQKELKQVKEKDNR